MASTSCLFSDGLSPCSINCHQPALNTTQLLSLAIRKRKQSSEAKHSDYRKDILHTGMIRYLCKHLGEERANRKRNRRSSSTSKRRWDLEKSSDKKVVIFNSDSAKFNPVKISKTPVPLSDSRWNLDIDKEFEKRISSKRLFFNTTSKCDKDKTPLKRKKFIDSSKNEKFNTNFELNDFGGDIFGLDDLQTSPKEIDYISEEYSIAFSDDCTSLIWERELTENEYFTDKDENKAKNW